MDIAARVIKWREKAGLSTYKLSKLSGVSQTYLREVEQGSKQPTVEIIDRICSGLGITLGEFFTEEVGSQDLPEDKSSDYMRVAARIAALREAAGYSQNALAKRAGIAQSTQREIELGSNSPNVITLAKICDALGITLSEFFSEETKADSPVTTRAAHLSGGARELPPEAEKELEQLMDYLRHKYGKQQ